jgi:SAM-dependent methyltransferase
MKRGRGLSAAAPKRGGGPGAVEGVKPAHHLPRASCPNNVIWQEVECGSYEADLALWRELAKGSALDLGCGTGRVTLHLATRGHQVVGLDRDASLLTAFEERAEGLAAEAVLGDAREFELDQAFDVVIAAMQLVQLFEGTSERIACLRRVAEHLRPGGLAAFAIVEDAPTTEAGSSAPPDVREVAGWIHSSLPLEVAVTAASIVVRRLRQTVSPLGELKEELDEVRLARLSAGTLEREALAAGLRAIGRREILPTETHVGSTVVLLERST